MTKKAPSRHFQLVEIRSQARCEAKDFDGRLCVLPRGHYGRHTTNPTRALQPTLRWEVRERQEDGSYTYVADASRRELLELWVVQLRGVIDEIMIERPDEV